MRYESYDDSVLALTVKAAMAAFEADKLKRIGDKVSVPLWDVHVPMEIITSKFWGYLVTELGRLNDRKNFCAEIEYVKFGEGNTPHDYATILEIKYITDAERMRIDAETESRKKAR